jgi:molecular chaperone HscB
MTEASTQLKVIQARPIQHKCWSCGDMRAEHFCGECGHVQPAVPTDFFAFFGLPRRLQLDEGKLEREFHALSRRLHPDVFSRASEREQSWSLEKTSQLNDAYRTLKDEISRTEYLLGLQGIQLEEQSKIATEQARAFGVEKKQTVTAELLEEAFELNMLLEEAKMGGVDDGVRAQLESTRDVLATRMNALRDELHAAWRRWDEGDISATETMVDLLNRRGYLRNLLRDIYEALG